MVFENGVKNIQAVAYNGAHTVHISIATNSKSQKSVLCSVSNKVKCQQKFREFIDLK